MVNGCAESGEPGHQKKELIIRGGHNIDPGMIEEPMHRHPAVAMVAAIASPRASNETLFVFKRFATEVLGTEMVDYRIDGSHQRTEERPVEDQPGPSEMF